jgi:hypothetical protein
LCIATVLLNVAPLTFALTGAIASLEDPLLLWCVSLVLRNTGCDCVRLRDAPGNKGLLPDAFDSRINTQVRGYDVGAGGLPLNFQYP